MLEGQRQARIVLGEDADTRGVSAPRVAREEGEIVAKGTKTEKKDREQLEYERLSALYQNIPANKRALVDGLLWQAARLRVSLDDLYADIKEHGNTEMFKQANDGVEFPRERPESKIFAIRDKSYLSIIKKLDELLPAQEVKSGFSKL